MLYQSKPNHTTLYDTVPYHTTLYHTIPYHTIPYHTIPYHTIPHYTIPYHTTLYHTIPYHIVHTSCPVPHCTILYSTIPLTTVHLYFRRTYGKRNQMVFGMKIVHFLRKLNTWLPTHWSHCDLNLNFTILWKKPRRPWRNLTSNINRK